MGQPLKVTQKARPHECTQHTSSLGAKTRDCKEAGRKVGEATGPVQAQGAGKPGQGGGSEGGNTQAYLGDILEIETTRPSRATDL